MNGYDPGSLEDFKLWLEGSDKPDSTVYPLLQIIEEYQREAQNQ